MWVRRAKLTTGKGPDWGRIESEERFGAMVLSSEEQQRSGKAVTCDIEGVIYRLLN